MILVRCDLMTSGGKISEGGDTNCLVRDPRTGSDPGNLGWLISPSGRILIASVGRPVELDTRPGGRLLRVLGNALDIRRPILRFALRLHFGAGWIVIALGPLRPAEDLLSR